MKGFISFLLVIHLFTAIVPTTALAIDAASPEEAACPERLETAPPIEPMENAPPVVGQMITAEQAPAELFVQETKAERQAAVVETAFAFYNRSKQIQYDSFVLTRESARFGETRRTDRFTPEDATDQYTHYTVCSSFCREVIENALGYTMFSAEMSITRDWMNLTPNLYVAYQYDCNQSGYMSPGQAAALEALIEPGDVLVGIHGETDDNSGGHAMMFVGGVYGTGVNYILHSSGTKYNSQTVGVDRIEANGTVLLATYASLFGKGASYSSESGGKNAACNMKLKVLRWTNPSAVSPTQYPITAATRTRMENPGLTITRTSSLDRFRDVLPGTEVTITLTLTNHSNRTYYKTVSGFNTSYTSLPITEYIPAGTSFVSANGFTRNGSTLFTTVSLAPGASKTLTYTVKVSNNAPIRSEIEFSGGSVGAIRSNSLYVPIGGVGAAIGGLAANLPVGIACASGIEFVEEFYETYLGQNLSLHTSAELGEGLFTKQTVYTNEEKTSTCSTTRVLKTSVLAAYQDESNMLVPHYLGGRYLRTIPVGSSDTKQADSRRIRTFSSGYLQPGDFLIYIGRPDKSLTGAAGDVNAYEGSHAEAYVYLGAGKLTYSNGGILCVTTPTQTEAILTRALLYDLFFLMRPSRRDQHPVCYADGDPSTTYYSLGEGIAAALADGEGEVTLLSDVSVAIENNSASDSYRPIDQTNENFVYYLGEGERLTLDLAGYILCTDTVGEAGASTSYKYLFRAGPDGALFVRNGTIVYGHKWSSLIPTVFYAQGTLALSNVRVISPGQSINVRSANAVVAVDGGVLTGALAGNQVLHSAIYVHKDAQGSRVTLSGGARLLSGGIAGSCPVNISKDAACKFTISDAEFYCAGGPGWCTEIGSAEWDGEMPASDGQIDISTLGFDFPAIFERNLTQNSMVACYRAAEAVGSLALHSITLETAVGAPIDALPAGRFAAVLHFTEYTPCCAVTFLIASYDANGRLLETRLVSPMRTVGISMSGRAAISNAAGATTSLKAVALASNGRPLCSAVTFSAT